MDVINEKNSVNCESPPAPPLLPIIENPVLDNVCGSLRIPEEEINPASDGGWAWLVCFGCFTTHMLTDGVFYSFGIIYDELLEYFGRTKGETAWVMSLHVGVAYLSCPIVAVLINIFGCRIVNVVGSLVLSGSYIVSAFAPNIYFLYGSIGIFAGFGYAMVYLASIVCVSQYFVKRRALATGIGVSGSGIGTFILSPITRLLIDSYAWQGALIIEGGLVLLCIICGLTFRPFPSVTKSNEPYANSDIAVKTVDPSKKDDLNNKDIENDKDSEIKLKNNCLKKYFDFNIFKNMSFCMYIVSTMFYSFGYYVPFLYISNRSINKGMTGDQGAWLISTIGITNTVGRVLFGYIADIACINRLYLYNVALIICGVSTCFAPYCDTFIILIIYCAVFGIFSGVTISLTSVLIADIVSIDSLADALGATNLFDGVICLIGTPLAGWMYDITGSYDASFITAGITLAISGAMLFIIPCINRTSSVQNTP